MSNKGELPYTPTNRAFVENGCYCAMGWQLHLAGKTDAQLERVHNDDLPPRAAFRHLEVAKFNARLCEIYSLNDQGKHVKSHELAEKLVAEMPKEFEEFCDWLNGTPESYL